MTAWRRLLPLFCVLLASCSDEPTAPSQHSAEPLPIPAAIPFSGSAPPNYVGSWNGRTFENACHEWISHVCTPPPLLSPEVCHRCASSVKWIDGKGWTHLKVS